MAGDICGVDVVPLEVEAGNCSLECCVDVGWCDILGCGCLVGEVGTEGGVVVVGMAPDVVDTPDECCYWAGDVMSGFMVDDLVAGAILLIVDAEGGC